jgi:hypothetical protein
MEEFYNEFLNKDGMSYKTDKLLADLGLKVGDTFTSQYYKPIGQEQKTYTYELISVSADGKDITLKDPGDTEYPTTVVEPLWFYLRRINGNPSLYEKNKGECKCCSI